MKRYIIGLILFISAIGLAGCDLFGSQTTDTTTVASTTAASTTAATTTTVAPTTTASTTTEATTIATTTEATTAVTTTETTTVPTTETTTAITTTETTTAITTTETTTAVTTTETTTAITTTETTTAVTTTETTTAITTTETTTAVTTTETTTVPTTETTTTTIVNIAPVITLIGGDITLTVGDEYVDQGATAFDNEDGDISTNIITVNPVDTNVVGVYTVTYNIVDSEGLAATEVTRTVTVIKATVNIGTLTQLYIEQNLNVDWEDVLADFGANTSYNVTLDTSVLGNTLLNIDGVEILVTVFSIYDEQMVSPGSVILSGAHAMYNDTYFYLNLVENAELDFYIISDGSGTVQLAGASGYHNYALLNLQVFESELNHTIFLDQGVYLMPIASSGIDSEQTKVIIKALSLVEQTTDLETNEFTIVSSEDLLETFTFSIDFNTEYMLYLETNYPIRVTVYDSSNNIINQSESMWIDYSSNQYRLYQVFDTGTYRVEVEHLQSPSRILAYLGYDVNGLNNGYAYAEPIDITLTNHIKVLKGSDWFTFSVTTAGWYSFLLENEMEEMWDFALYDSYGTEIAYAQNLIYLPTGTYNMRFPSYSGEFDLKVERVQGTQTLNNDDTSALPFTIGTLYEVYLDGENTTKWYSFTTTQSGHYNFYVYNGYYYYQGAALTIYDDQLNIINNPFEKELISLDAGTYYLTLTGTSGLSIPFIAEQVDISEIDTTVPIPFVFGTEYHSFYTAGTNHNYTLELTQDTLIELSTGEVTGNLRMEILKDGNVIEDFVLYGNNTQYKLFEAGSYEVRLYYTANCIYSITLRDATDKVWGFDTTYDTDKYLDFKSNPQIFVSDAGVHVFIKYNAEELQLLQAYVLNAETITIYDELDQVIYSGSPYQAFPLPLAIGIYTFEIISYGEGIIEFMEANTNSLNIYGTNFDTATQVDSIFYLSGFNGNAPFTNVVAFDIMNEGLYMFDVYSNIDYIIINSEGIEVFDSKISGYTPYHFFTEDSYKMVIVSRDKYFEFKMFNISNLVPGTSFSDTLEIYINEQTDLFLQDQYHPGYLSFYVPVDSYLKFEYNTSEFHVEIFNSMMVFQDDSFFEAGMYYIRISKLPDYCQGICEPSLFGFDITNITPFVLNNDFDTALTLTENEIIKGQLLSEESEAWFTFTLDQPSMVNLYLMNSYVGMYKLYDESGNLIKDLTSSLHYLPAGTYYVLAYKYGYDIGIKYNIYQYVDVADESINAVELLDESPSASSFIQDSTDTDWYTFTASEESLYRVYITNAWVKLYDDNNTLLQTFYSSGYKLLPAGTYYFEVSYSYLTSYSVQFNKHNEWIVSDSFANAREITLNDWVYGYKLTYTEVDMYTFEVFTNTTISFNQPTYFTLYDSAYNEVTDFNLTPGVYYVKYTTSYSGYYSFIIYSGGGGSTTSDNLIMNDKETAVEITDLFFDLYDYQDTYGEVDWYTITLTDAQLYEISISGWNQPQLTIYAEDNSVVFQEYMWQSFPVYLQPGTYYITVAQTTGVYDLHFKEKTFTDYPSEFIDAEEIFLYDVISSYLFSDAEIDWLEFTLDQTTFLRVNTFDVTVDLYTDSDTLHTANIAGKYTFLEPGTYYIKLSTSGFTGYTISFDLANEWVYPTTFADAMELPLYSLPYYINGILNPNVPIYFKLVLTEEHEILFNSLNTFTIYDSLEQVFEGSVFPAGTYYIKIEATNFITFNFEYRAIDELSVDETTFAPIIINQRQFLYSSDLSEIDSFQVTPAVDTLVSFNFLVGGYAIIIIEDSLGNVIFDNTYNQYNLPNERILLVGGETYYFTITDIVGEYSFILEDNSFTDEGGSTMDTAEEIALIMQHSGTIINATDVDWYKIVIDNSYSSISMFLDNGSDIVSYEIYDESGNLLGTDDTLIPTPVGTYYIKIFNPQPATYSFTVSLIME